MGAKARFLTPYPILRLTIPMAAGIFFAGSLPFQGSLEILMAIILVLLLGMLWLTGSKSYTCRWLYGVCTFLLFFLVGCFRMQQRWEQVKPEWPEAKQMYSAMVQDFPVEKAKSYLCRVKVGHQNVFLYLAKDSLSKGLSAGDRLLLYTRIQPPANLDGHSDFDYASYLLMKGVSGTAYVPSDGWTKEAVSLAPNLKQRALSVRNRIVFWYREWGIGEEQLPVLSALTVGYKADLDDELRDAYSAAGISHVLALSGMHIGFLWLLLSVLLKPLNGRLGWRIVRWMISTLALWTFAFIAGLEASVVRAVIMCMLMELGKLNGGKVLSMNTLSVAALGMLLYNPFYLYDVGFQLSFLAVGAIFLCYPMLFHSLALPHGFLRKLWGIVSISLAAQLGTAPLVMYYFNNFSLCFLLANLVVAFAVPFIIYTAFACILIAPIGWLHGGLVIVLDRMVAGLNAFALWMGNLPYASLTGIRLEKLEVWGIYLLMGILWWFLTVRQRKLLILALFVFALLLGYHAARLYALL